MCPPGGAKKQPNLTTFSFRFAFIWAKNFSLVSRASLVSTSNILICLPSGGSTIGLASWWVSCYSMAQECWKLKRLWIYILYSYIEPCNKFDDCKSDSFRVQIVSFYEFSIFRMKILKLYEVCFILSKYFIFHLYFFDPILYSPISSIFYIFFIFSTTSRTPFATLQFFSPHLKRVWEVVDDVHVETWKKGSIMSILRRLPISSRFI